MAEEISERLLIEQLKGGKEAAFRTLYDRYSSQLLGFAYKFFGNRTDAEEIVQETFTRVWIHRSKIDPSQSFQNYLFVIARNYAYTYAKRHIQRQSLDFELVAEITANTTDEADKPLSLLELQTKIDQALEQLPKRSREVFLLSREQSLSHREIASQLNLSVRTVETHIHTALKGLRKQLKTDLTDLILLLFMLDLMS